MICQTCQGDGRRLNPALQVLEHGDQTYINNPCGLPVLVECPACRGSGTADDRGIGQRMRETIEDVDGMVTEVLTAQPMLKAKRNALLGRLRRIRHNLEILRGIGQ